MMSLALCVGVAFFLLISSAMAAGTTRLATGLTSPSTYASELMLTPVTGGITYTLISGAFDSNLYRAMTVARTTAQNFTVVVTLSDGAKFAAGRLPLGTDVTVDSISGGGVGAATFSIATGGTAGSTSVTFLSSITTSFTGFPTIKIAAGTNGWTILDTNNRLAAGSIKATVRTYDAADGTQIDYDAANPDTGVSVDFLRASNAVIIPVPPFGVGVFTPTTAVVDVANGRQKFVATAPDTITVDNGASVAVAYATPTPLAPAGTAFALAAADIVKFTFTTSGDFTGLTTNLLSGATTGITWNAVAATGTGTSRIISIAGNDASINGGAKNFVFTVNGTTILQPRTFSVGIELNLATGGSTTNGGTRSLMAVTPVTVWTYNGSVLVANWLSGDSNTYKSRIYLWNPSSTTGAVTVRVFNMPLVGGGNAAELTTAGSPLNLGDLAGNSSMAIRLYEDILGPSGLNIAPYTLYGGNVIVEITIRANGVRGTCQVFSVNGAMQFGQVPLQIVQ